ncbi:hypothetical protein [Bacillus phage SDFMU_Pfc]|nr:hypothetical protein [Bacillus phage SDFMU_Pfc]
MNLENLKAQLMSRIDTNDLLEVKKVERYIELLKLDKQCNEVLERDGSTIIIENGKQRFIKSHPAMTDKTKINTQLIALEKSFNFVDEGLPPAASTVEGKSKEEYSEDDLI